MAFDTDLTACAALVEKADPARFLAVMAVPVPARRVLFPIFALNIEVARAPWVTEESMIAEMRLQWWRDALAEISAGGIVRRHEVVTPLSQVLAPALAARLDEMVAARRWDIYRDPFEDEAHFDRYIDATSGHLTSAAALSLGQADETVLRDFAYGVGIANWLCAVPELEARRRVPLLDGTGEGVRNLAQKALERLQKARSQRAKISPEAAQALFSGWQASRLLRQVIADPPRVGEGRLGGIDTRDRLALMLRVARGRW